MRYSESDHPEFKEVVVEESTEERLRRENEALRRQLQEHQAKGHETPVVKPPHPSHTALWLIAIGLLVAIVVAFLVGYLPNKKRENTILAEEQDHAAALPLVTVVQVTRSAEKSELVLPGNIQAVTEAPILARADGYIKRRMVDIGDRVTAGQPMAEIEAPELDQQVLQAKAALQQIQAALDQTLANYEQGKANLELARSTANRWKELESRGVVSRQENEQNQAQFRSQTASVDSLEKAIAAARGNVASSQANLARLQELQSYKMVKAPFAGVVTLRNVDVGALITGGNTLLFRVAETGMLRTYVNVPQSNADSVKVGQPVDLTFSNLSGRKFAGVVTRTSNSLDPASRTLLVEAQVHNVDGLILPGMYTLVHLNSSRTDPPVSIPGDTLLVLSDGTQVAVVRPDHTVHFQKIDVGRDFGDRLEVLSGLNEHDLVIANPGDAVREGAKVNPVFVSTKSKGKTAGK